LHLIQFHCVLASNVKLRTQGEQRAIKQGRELVLGLGANDRAATVFQRLHAQFADTA
jgi:hypothetical protein